MAQDAQIEVEAYVFGDDGKVPNSALPALVYRQALGGGDDPEAFDRLFGENGWTNGWHDGIFPYTHFHTSAHEVLGIASGEAELMLGGERGRALTVAAGDVIVIPAGVGHRRLRASADFLVVGAYAGGRDYDVKRDEARDPEQVRAAIRAVPLPQADPVQGEAGPLLRKWRSSQA